MILWDVEGVCGWLLFCRFFELEFWDARDVCWLILFFIVCCFLCCLCVGCFVGDYFFLWWVVFLFLLCLLFLCF